MRRVVIIEDDRQHAGKHEQKHEWWEAHGVSYLSRDEMLKLDFGDYVRGFEDGSPDPDANVSVDTKQHLGEVSTNLGRGHGRFAREIARANAAGYLLVVLVESGEASCIADVESWTNPHCIRCSWHRGGECNPRNRSDVCLKHGTGKPLQGDVIAKQMATMERTRSVRFEFCEPQESARRICELLGVSYDDKGD